MNLFQKSRVHLSLIAFGVVASASALAQQITGFTRFAINDHAD